MNRNQRIVVLMLLLMLVLSFLVYPQLPASITTHWGMKGEANGFSGKTFGLFFMPIFSFAIYAFLVWIPKLDPKKKNIEEFKSTYETFLILFFLFMFYLHLLTILWNLGMKVSFNQALAPAMSVLFYSMGILIGKAKLNYFIGIRTPWTLSNEKVWDETHQKGGIAFKVIAIISFLGFFFADFYIWILFGSIIIATVYTIVLSYFVYKRVTKDSE